MNAVVAEAAEAPAKPKKEVIPPEVVTMSDGRKVEFAGKKKLLKDIILNEDGSLAYVLFDFRNGETRTFDPVPAVNGYALGHGYSQKIGDETAGEEDVDDMVLAVDAIIERLQKGDWKTERVGGGMAGTSVLLKALMEYGNRTKEQVQAFLAGKSKVEKDALRADNKRKNANGLTVKDIVQRLEAEKVSKAAKVDTGALLEGL